MNASSGFLGTGASLLSDLSLLAYILLIVPGMIIGAIFARRGMHRPQHKWMMVAITAVNWLLILFLMIGAYTFDVAENVVQQPGNMRYLIPTVHALFGLPAQLLATYIVFQMLREDMQVAIARRHGASEQEVQQYWFKSAKPLMRLTLVLWLITAGFGILTYLIRYEVVPALAIVPLSPAATVEVTESAPVSTPEITITPLLTPEVQSVPQPPVQTAEASPPVQTPEVQPPAFTPEADPEPEFEDDDDDDDGGRRDNSGMGSN